MPVDRHTVLLHRADRGTDARKLGHPLLADLKRVGKRHKGSVEQAGFTVLKAPDSPSVLVEAAFVSNPEEEARLDSPECQNRLADALMRGIQNYCERKLAAGHEPCDLVTQWLRRRPVAIDG